MVIEDAYSKFPEVFLTTSASADFTKTALRRFFSREGVAQVIVSDNGSHFTADSLRSWLAKIGCHTIYSAPRHPCSNGLAENFVKSLKTAIQAASPTTLEELNNAIDTFLLHYRNAVHATTRKTPAMLFKGRNLRFSANVDTTEVIFFHGNNARPSNGLILGPIGNRMFNVMDQTDGTIYRRHVDQINMSKIYEIPQQSIQPTSESDFNPLVNSTPTASVSDCADPIRTDQGNTPDANCQSLVSDSNIQKSICEDSYQEQQSPIQPLRRSNRSRFPTVTLKDYEMHF